MPRKRTTVWMCWDLEGSPTSMAVRNTLMDMELRRIGYLGGEEVETGRKLTLLENLRGAGVAKVLMEGPHQVLLRLYHIGKMRDEKQWAETLVTGLKLGGVDAAVQTVTD